MKKFLLITLYFTLCCCSSQNHAVNYTYKSAQETIDEELSAYFSIADISQLGYERARERAQERRKTAQEEKARKAEQEREEKARKAEQEREEKARKAKEWEIELHKLDSLRIIFIKNNNVVESFSKNLEIRKKYLNEIEKYKKQRLNELDLLEKQYIGRLNGEVFLTKKEELNLKWEKKMLPILNKLEAESNFIENYIKDFNDFIKEEIKLITIKYVVKDSFLNFFSDDTIFFSNGTIRYSEYINRFNDKHEITIY